MYYEFCITNNYHYLCRRILLVGLRLSAIPPIGSAARGNNRKTYNRMYAIVEIQGQQFKAEPNKFLYVHYLGENTKEGDKVEFDRVLLSDVDGAVKVGAPLVDGAKVVCEVLTPLVKGDKVIVFKKKRRKGYRRKNGHRQFFSKVLIKEVVA